MATITGSSSSNSSGGWLEVRLTYSVENNLVTFTKLEARKQPSSLTVATTGTWPMTIRCGYNNVLVNEFISASVYGNKWTTLWSGEETSVITSDTTIYGVVAAPDGTSYSGLTATAQTTISYEEDDDDDFMHSVTIRHYYGANCIHIDSFQAEDGALLILSSYELDSIEYVFTHATDGYGDEIQGQKRIYEDMTIYMYYDKLQTWTVYDKSDMSGELGGTFDFAQYQIYRWYYYVPEDMKIEFSTSGNADTIGWISDSDEWSVSDNGEPKTGYYIVMDDESGSGNNFSLTYDVKKGERIRLYVSIYQGQAAENVDVNIMFVKDKYKVTMLYTVPDDSSTSGFRLVFSEQLEFKRNENVSPEDYIYPDDWDPSHVFSHVTIRKTTTYASDISTLSYKIDRDEDWDFYYTRSYWSWRSANRSTSDAASTEQTVKAYEAITGQGIVSDFHYKVWNDLCAVTKDVLAKKSYTWDTKYATYNNTLMSDASKTLTAVRFNSLRKNIDKLYFTNITEKTKYEGTVTDSNKVIGNEFIIMTNCLNKA